MSPRRITGSTCVRRDARARSAAATARVDDVLVYEAALDDVVDRKSAVFVCMDDPLRFGLDMLVAALQTHPVVRLDRTVRDNPHVASRAEGPPVVKGSIGRRRLGAAPVDAGESDAWSSLTASEVRIAGLVAKGLTNKDVAEQLCVSPHTVDAHLKHVYLKLAIHSRVELAVLAMQHRAPLL